MASRCRELMRSLAATYHTSFFSSLRMPLL